MHCFQRKLLKWQVFQPNCIPFSDIYWKITDFKENDQIWLVFSKLVYFLIESYPVHWYSLKTWFSKKIIKMTSFSVKLHTVHWYSLKNYSFQWENFKFAKNHENIKFSTEMPYRLVSLLEKLQISGKITNFSENDQIWLVFSKYIVQNI